MKFWEALKAVEEGKTVQFKGAVSWIVWDQRKNGTLEMYEGYEWRIKPEPKILYFISRNDGSYFSSSASEEETNRMVDRYNNTPLGDANNRPYRAIKFVEVMED